MNEAEHSGMKRLPFECLQSFSQPGISDPALSTELPIYRIPCHGETDKCKMDPNLMRSPRLGVHFEKCQSAKAFLGGPPCNRAAALPRLGRYSFSLLDMPTYGSIDGPGLFTRVTPYQRQIHPVN